MSNGVEPPARQDWFEEDPGRRELELSWIQEIDDAATDDVRGDHLFISTKASYQGAEFPVTIEFPTDYPFVPPILSGPAGLIERHQNPFHGNFCIIDNEEHWWRPDYRAADLLLELQSLLDADEAGVVAEAERDMPEPLSGYVAKRPAMVVFVFDEALLLALLAGEGSFRLEPLNDHQSVLTELRSSDGVVVATLPDELRRWFRISGSGRVRGRWTSIDQALGADGGEAIAAAAAGTVQSALKDARKRTGWRPPRNLWSAVTFFEQGPQRGETRRNWFFYESSTTSSGGIESPGAPIMTQAISKAVREDRLKELKGLEDSRFLVVGAGAIGGQLTLELAKAGVGHIDVVDGDFYDTGNAVRHPLPVDAGGLGKAQQVAELAQRFNPFSRVEAHATTLGRSTDAAVLADALVQSADVVVDTTGLHSVTRLLHRRCVEIGKLGLVSAALSVGGYGGRVVVLHHRSPCFDCFLQDPNIPVPAEGEADNTTPYGCSHPAASCAGFDALELVANTARTAVRLVPTVEYPSLDFDWAVMNFRPGFERWAQGRLTAQPDCPWCRA